MIREEEVADTVHVHKWQDLGRFRRCNCGSLLIKAGAWTDEEIETMREESHKAYKGEISVMEIK